MFYGTHTTPSIQYPHLLITVCQYLLKKRLGLFFDYSQNSIWYVGTLKTENNQEQKSSSFYPLLVTFSFAWISGFIRLLSWRTAVLAGLEDQPESCPVQLVMLKRALLVLLQPYDLATVKVVPNWLCCTLFFPHFFLTRMGIVIFTLPCKTMFKNDAKKNKWLFSLIFF